MATTLFVFVLVLCTAIVSKLMISGAEETAQNLAMAQLRKEFYKDMTTQRSADVLNNKKYDKLRGLAVGELTHAAIWGLPLPPFSEICFNVKDWAFGKVQFLRTFLRFIPNRISIYVWREVNVKDVSFEIEDWAFYYIYRESTSIGARGGMLHVFNREGAIIYSAPNTRSERIKFLKVFGVLPRGM